MEACQRGISVSLVIDHYGSVKYERLDCLLLIFVLLNRFVSHVSKLFLLESLSLMITWSDSKQLEQVGHSSSVNALRWFDLIWNEVISDN